MRSQRRRSKRDSVGPFEGDTNEAQDPTSPVSPTRSNVLSLDETDYISIYLCCESEVSLRKFGPPEAIDACVDFALFVASCSEEYGMERKVCIGRRFKTSGQAMGFRRHIRRNRLHSPTAGLYNREKDELVVGAHLVAPEVQHSRLPSELTAPLGSVSLTGDDFRSESPLSPSSTQLAGSRMTTMETEPSPILTSTSRVST
ncbi:TRAF-like protein [Gracilaria domingensis]|nr:TRAF-like protein [Gracilaria domingensis]